MKVCIPALRSLVRFHRDHKDEMVTPVAIAQQMIDWTDPRKLVKVEEEMDECLHADLAIAILKEAIKGSTGA